MRMLMIEGLTILIVSAIVIVAAWKLILSKIPAIRVFFKMSDIAETHSLAGKASAVDMAKAKDHKTIINDFTKEKL
jgi:hypothetical protein